MGRKIEFNREKALTKATDLFWKQGFTSTSMAQLLKAMKVGEGSFYNSFGSKRALYLECVQHYNATAMQARMAALKSTRPARQRIADFFNVVAEEMATNRNPGCMFSNSLTWETLSQRDYKSFASSSIDGFLEFLGAMIREGQKSGDIRAKSDADALAKLLFTHLHGIHRLSVHAYAPQQQKKQTELLLKALLD